MRSSLRLALLASVLSSMQAVTPGSPQIDAYRELSILDLGVVEDPVRTTAGGAWHFGTMMANLAGDVPSSRFVEAWLNTFMQPQVVNGVTVFDQQKANAIAEFRNRWPKKPNGLVDLAQSPFRLLAIVNRPDLLQVGPSGPTSFGECRFVYGAFNPLQPNGTQKFFVIFEFDVPAVGCSAVVNWANAWHALGSLTAGSPAYNTALQAITDAVVLRVPGSTRPNQSNLKQLRTNEFGLLGFDASWSLREWNLVAAGEPNLAVLTTVTTKQTPHFDFLQTPGGRQTLADYLTSDRAAIQAGTHVVPDFFQSESFQSGNAPNDCAHPTPTTNCAISGFQCPGTAGTKWWAPGFVPNCGGTTDDGDVRHKFALQTCSGCHFQETGVEFVHVSHRSPGQESHLSKFLTGEDYPIPDLFSGWDLPHSFNDLALRAAVLSGMLELDCTPPIEGPSAQEQLEGMQAARGTRVH